MTADLLKLVAWTCSFLTLAVYVGYPVAVYVMGGLIFGLRKKQRFGYMVGNSMEDYALPMVSVIVSARNEEKEIASRIRNIISMDYPRDRMEIIVAVNDSSDRTREVCSRFGEFGVQCFVTERSGKTVAQNMVVPGCSGEIVVFMDADLHTEKDALKIMMREFGDPSVGVVHGWVYSGDEKYESLYKVYEMFVKTRESSAGLCLTALGGLMAVRKVLWREVDPSVMEDFAIPIIAISDGYRSVFTPDALASGTTYSSTGKWVESKRRIAAQDMKGFIYVFDILARRRQWLLALLLILRKPMRWVGLLYMVPAQAAFLALAYLWHDLWLFPAGLIAGWNLWAVSGAIMGKVNPAFSFYLIHWGALLGVIDFFLGKRIPAWNRDGGS